MLEDVKFTESFSFVRASVMETSHCLGASVTKTVVVVVVAAVGVVAAAVRLVVAVVVVVVAVVWITEHFRYPHSISPGTSQLPPRFYFRSYVKSSCSNM